MASVDDYINVEHKPVVPDDALDRFRDEIQRALLIRRTEEELLRLFRQGKLFGTVHTCIGQEFVGVSVARALRPQDTLFSNHRGHGHFLAYCGDVTGLIGEVMGRSIGVCGGRGGSQHLHRDHYYSNGIQGGIVPVAAGLALGHELRRTGGISVVFIGDGTLGQGSVYESMNIASKWQLPLLIVCENNLFAQSTCQSQTLAGDICLRARAFGIETAHSDTWDWPRLFETMGECADRVRETGRPVFHRVDTFRLKAHSKGDDNRPPDYVEAHLRRDPLHALEARFGGDAAWQTMLEQVEARVEQATQTAEAAEPARLAAETASPATPVTWARLRFPRRRVVEAVRDGLRQALGECPETILIGEDIESPYGGAFKCTMGLSDEFPGRVRNTPISELALAGIANGLALSGLKPIVEIMFGDFLTLTADQWINHAAKFRYMFGDQVRLPLVLRTPMGGRRGYAATHSQSLEKHFLGLPGTRVLCLHHRCDPARLYRDLLATLDRPTLVVENKQLYGQYCSSEPPAGFDLTSTEGRRFPTARLAPQATPEVTIVAIGGTSVEAEPALLRLFEEQEVAAELFLPTRLYPFDVELLEGSLRRTRRLLVVEEGQGFVSLSSEILAQVAERPGLADVRCRRLTAAPRPIPAARPLEELSLPGTGDIVAAAMELMSERID